MYNLYIKLAIHLYSCKPLYTSSKEMENQVPSKVWY